MTDKKGRLFGKVNVVDLCIILLVVVAIFATVYKFGFSAHKDVNQSSIKIEYVLKVSGIRDFTVNSMETGLEIYEDKTNKFMGVLKNVETEPAKDYVLKSDGTFNYAEKPDRFDAYLTIESDARILDGGYFANGNKEIGRYSNINIYSQKFFCESEVVDVKEIK